MRVAGRFDGSKFGLRKHGFFGRDALDQGGIFQHDSFRAEEVGQRNQDGFAFGQQEDAAGFKIEPVRNHEIIQSACCGPRHSALNVLMKKLQQTRTLRVAAIGRSQEKRRFVECEKVLVFK